MSQAAPVKFRIAFQRKDLVVAAWGSSKGADLLYHFIYKACREAEKQSIPESGKSITFQELQEKIMEYTGLCKRSLNGWLKLFSEAGYVAHEHYSKAFTVNLEAVERAFTMPPAKPGSEQREQPPKKPKVAKVAKVEHSECITLPLSEWQEMQQKVLLLQQKVAKVEQYLAKVELLQSSEQAPENDAEAKNEALYALDNNREREKSANENAPSENVASLFPLSGIEEAEVPYVPNYSLNQKVDSYSPESEDLTPSEEKLNPKQAMDRKVKTAFQVLEATKKEALSDPGACYAPSKEDGKRMAELITTCETTPNRVTKSSLRAAWLNLYNKPDGFWKKSGVLTIKAFCANYSAAMDAVRDAHRLEELRQAKQERPAINPHLAEMRRQRAEIQASEERKVAAL